jgi:hypothetical protein
VPGAFTFIEEGNSFADTGWVCTSDPGGTLGVTAINWTQFSAAGVYTFQAGLQVANGTEVSVKPGDGIETSSNGNATNVKLAASNSSLQFISGGLGLALNATDPGLSLSGGLAISLGTTPALSTSGGLHVTLSGSTLGTDSSGLYVAGVPAGFTIDGSATNGSNVSASNLDTLVADFGASASPSGDASALHSHGSASMFVTADQYGWTAGDPVQMKGNDLAGKARADDVSTGGWVVGVAATASAGDATNKQIITSGVAKGVLNPAFTTGGVVYYLSQAGGLTSNFNNIDAGNRVIMMGIAKNATDLIVQVRDFGQKAA